MASPKRPDPNKNLLFYGDCLDVLQEWIPAESVDLIYLDPPFNSNRTYNVLFKQQSGEAANAQITAFDDTWTWSSDDEVAFAELQANAAPKVADVIAAIYRLLGPSDMLSYLVMMTVRLIELRRVMKPSGSLYLHCDPVASHYLKLVLDAIFGPENFRNEVIWQRVAAKGGQMGRLPANHDVLLAYGRSANVTWNEIRVPYNLADLDEKTLGKYRYFDDDGRRFRLGPLLHPEQGQRPNLEYELMGVVRTWRWSQDRMMKAVEDGRVVQTAPGRVPQQKMYLDEQPGRLVGDVWTDISVINSRAAERLGYPTQKPLALLERIIEASSNPGDVVLDPFCGCGTAVDAAQRLGRRWIGVDISYLAVDLIETRMLDAYGAELADQFEVVGVPRDPEGAVALFRRSPFDFERWAVSLIDGTPNEKQVGDKGVDGVVRFPLDGDKGVGRIIVSVKGGATVTPSMVRDLDSTVRTQGGSMGMLIQNAQPTAGVIDAAGSTGTFVHPLTSQSYPKVQIATVADLLAGKRPKMPTPFMPYLKAEKFVPEHPTLPGIG